MARSTGLPKSLLKLIELFKKFPGVGQKSAQRLAFFILKSPAEYTKELSEAVTKVKEAVRFCRICNNLSDEETCGICNDPSRDRTAICVVEEPTDVIAVENTGRYHGAYHVLLGVLSPLDGIGPEELKIKGLLERVKASRPKEVIIATNPDTEGETTALYLKKVLKQFDVKVTRLGYGIPVGADLEYADYATLMKAIESRQELT